MKEPPADPRHAPAFQADLFPLCDGEPLPGEADNEIGRRKLALVTAFYHVNRASLSLRQFRESHGDSPPPEAERPLLQQVESALLHKEEEEDALAPFGICGRPTLQRGIVINLEFCEPGKTGERKIVVAQSSAIRFEFDFELPWDNPNEKP